MDGEVSVGDLETSIGTSARLADETIGIVCVGTLCSIVRAAVPVGDTTSITPANSSLSLIVEYSSATPSSTSRLHCIWTAECLKVTTAITVDFAIRIAAASFQGAPAATVQACIEIRTYEIYLFISVLA